MKKILILLSFLCQSFLLFSQTLSPHVLATAGGYFSAGGNSLSWTMGETFTSTLQNGNVILTQGQQQPYVQLTILNLKMYIEGFYLSAGIMNNCLNITGYSANPLDADSVTISVMNAASPYALKESQKGILKTNGDVTVKFSQAVIPNTSYYIKVNHRNTIETWSKNPVLLTQNTLYSFASNATQAFDNNEKLTPDNLVYAFYSGDVNQDLTIDATDFLIIDPFIQNGDSGYLVSDINGDGSVDASDFLIMDPNIQNGIGASYPLP